MVVKKFFAMAYLKWIVVACVVCSSLAVETTSKNCNPNDMLALKKMASSLTNGSIISSWSNNSYCCEWDGVGCEKGVNGSSASRVTELNLSNRGLKGVISQSLRNLDQLKLLNLSYNRLQGGLTMDLSNLKQLEVLDLSHNMLTGPVWGALAGLRSVQTLNISSNLLTGNFTEFLGFPNLVALNVSNNSFSGGFNSRICNMSNKIKFIDISRNHFTGGLEGLHTCGESLQQLHLDSNSFSGQLPESLYSMSSLEELTLSSNSISGQLSPKLGKLSNLKSLILHGNEFSGSLPNVFGNLTRLEVLVAQSNLISGPLPSTLARCSKLQTLNLQNNSLSGPLDLDFTGLPNLYDLDLGSNHLSGHLPESLSSCQKLKILSLGKNMLTGPIPLNYENLTSLVFLSLSNNTLVNISQSLSVLQQCKNLTTIILPRNFNGEEMPNNLSGFEKITTFALGKSGLRGKIPIWLKRSKKLQALDLSGNHLEGNIPSWIGEMDQLFYLELSNNSLSGEIPKSLTNLKSLVSGSPCISALNSSTGIPLFVKRNQSASGLQYNQLSNFPPSILLGNNDLNGTIWPEIGRLKQLHTLDLSRNRITGTIPSSISNMSNLETLDLSDNDLTGSIPSSLNKLTFLAQFSVANNHLQGAIPTGGQFFSFPSSSFEGNPGLCGKIVSPCENDNTGTNPSATSGSHKKFGRGRILGITLSIGVGLALLLSFLLLKMSQRDIGHPIEDVDDEITRPSRLSDAYGPSKLVLFPAAECKDLTIADLLKSTNNFNQSNIVGCGGFGLVYKADMPDGSKAAIKRLSGDCGQIEREFQAEVEALSRAQHKNLVSLQGYCLYGSDRLLIYSYMENGSLDCWLHEKVDGSSFLKWETRLKIAQGAARGLAYLHKEPNIIHRDIKTSNILLDEKFEAHLADFGLSRLLHPYDTHVTTDLVGTLGYIPPEYSQTLTATFRGDVYSFGVVLIELLTGRRPVEVCKGKNCRNVVSWVFQMKSEKKEVEVFDSTIWNKDWEKQLLEVLSIACRCLDQDPRRRPSIDQVVSWLDAIETEKVSNGLQ